MADIGNKRKFYMASSLSATEWTWLAGEQSNDFARSADAIECSDKSSRWKKFEAGINGATANVKVYTDDSDTQQKSLLDSLDAGTHVFCFIGELSVSQNTTTLSKGDAFEAIITGISDTNDNGSISSRDISLQVSGAPVHYPTA